MNEHDTSQVTPAGRSALLDLAANDEDAVELQMRSTLLRGLERRRKICGQNCRGRGIQLNR